MLRLRKISRNKLKTSGDESCCGLQSSCSIAESVML